MNLSPHVFDASAGNFPRLVMETALKQLPMLDSDHPDSRNGMPRKALLALSALPGAEDPLARKYRARLAQNLS